MGTSFSSYYDLVRTRELGPEAKDWATTDKNFEVLSRILKTFEQHVHTGLPGLNGPTVPVSISVANPAVITRTAHGLTADTPVRFYTTGALPTGISVGTTYFVLAAGLTANTFEISTTTGGAAVVTSGTQTGQQSIATQPILTEQSTGGSLAPGTTVGVRLSYTNSQSLETWATTETDITLTSAADRPLAPIFNLLQALAGALSGGTYMYVFTKVKGTGETEASDALPVTVPYDQTYGVTLNFDAINTYTDGTTQLNVYRSAGLNSSFQLVGEITDVNATSFTDDNTSVDQTAQPPSTSTFDITKAVVINWSQLGTYPTDAINLNIYVTQQPGVWATQHLLTSINLQTSPPSSWTYLGSETLSVGYPYEITQIPNSPQLIDNSQLAAGAGGGGGGGGSATGAPPVGTIVPYTGTGDPTVVIGAGQWVITDGRLIDKTTYSVFFSTTGHSYNGGVDPGGNNVRIPDKRGKKSVGAINMGSAGGSGANDNSHIQVALGLSTGEVNHTLLNSEMPVHSHSGLTGNDTPDHTHSGTTGTESNDHTHGFAGNFPFPPSLGAWAKVIVQAASGPANVVVPFNNNYNSDNSSVTAGRSSSHTHTFSSGGASARHAHQISVDGGSVGVTQSHNNVDPSQADSYIVRIA